MTNYEKMDVLRILDLLKSIHNVSFNINIGSTTNGYYSIYIYWNTEKEKVQLDVLKKNDVFQQVLESYEFDGLENSDLEKKSLECFKKYSYKLINKFLEEEKNGEM